MTTIAVADWRWFGNAAHLIVGHDCRFHLATQIGPWMVSTVGQWLPGESSREITAQVRGIRLEGKGDARRRDFLNKIGYEEIGYGRTFETAVFRAGAPCQCGCGLPEIDGSELGIAGYNDASAATAGHYAMCEKWAATAIAADLSTPPRPEGR